MRNKSCNCFSMWDSETSVNRSSGMRQRRGDKMIEEAGREEMTKKKESSGLRNVSEELKIEG